MRSTHELIIAKVVFRTGIIDKKSNYELKSSRNAQGRGWPKLGFEIILHHLGGCLSLSSFFSGTLSLQRQIYALRNQTNHPFI